MTCFTLHLHSPETTMTTFLRSGLAALLAGSILTPALAHDPAPERWCATTQS